MTSPEKEQKFDRRVGCQQPEQDRIPGAKSLQAMPERLGPGSDRLSVLKSVEVREECRCIGISGFGILAHRFGGDRIERWRR